MDGPFPNIVFYSKNAYCFKRNWTVICKLYVVEDIEVAIVFYNHKRRLIWTRALRNVTKSYEHL